jgi:aminopeptidase YwaD
MISKPLSLIFIFLFFILSVAAQDLPYAHRILNTLTSKEFAGRGYVNDGCEKAANFIRQQFDSLQLESFSKNYSQPFSFPVNTFPGEMEISIDGKKLIPGDDYIVHPHASSSVGKFKLKRVFEYSNPKIFNRHPETCYVILPDSLPDQMRIDLFKDLLSGKIKAGALILLNQKKLTWSVARDHYKIPVATILQYYIPENAKEVSFRITEKFSPDFKTENVVGYVRGTLIPDSFLVFSAHYDHLGMMGQETYFPGANDNASGVSMLLNIASYFSKKENHPEYSIAFIAFAGEEAGLVGSKFYTEHPLFDLSKIKFLINLDLLGTGDDGMMVVNATEFPKQFQLLDTINKNKNETCTARQSKEQ